MVALSVDSEEDAQKTAERNSLTHPVLYGLDAREMASTIGTYINEEPLYLLRFAALRNFDILVSRNAV